MNASTTFEATARRLVRATIAIAAIAAVALAASSLPASAATSRGADVQSGATRIVVHVNRGLNATANRYATYTTTSASLIEGIIERVNTLPTAPPMGEMCPMDVGATLTLSFYRHGTHPYAVVVADPGGCGAVTLRSYNANDALNGSAARGGGAAFCAYVGARLHIKTLQVL
jgi:hypothetical protein